MFTATSAEGARAFHAFVREHGRHILAGNDVQADLDGFVGDGDDGTENTQAQSHVVLSWMSRMHDGACNFKLHLQARGVADVLTRSSGHAVNGGDVDPATASGAACSVATGE